MTSLTIQWRHNEGDGVSNPPWRLDCLLNRLFRRRATAVLSWYVGKCVAVWYGWNYNHYDDVIMNAIASQITSLMIVYSTVYSDADQSKHQSSASLAFVWGIHRDRWIPRTKGQLRGKCFHLMTSSCKANFLWNSNCKWQIRVPICLVGVGWGWGLNSLKKNKTFCEMNPLQNYKGVNSIYKSIWNIPLIWHQTTFKI